MTEQGGLRRSARLTRGTKLCKGNSAKSMPVEDNLASGNAGNLDDDPGLQHDDPLDRDNVALGNRSDTPRSDA